MAFCFFTVTLTLIQFKIVTKTQVSNWEGGHVAEKILALVKWIILISGGIHVPLLLDGHHKH